MTWRYRWRSRRHDRTDINCVHWDCQVRESGGTCSPCLATGGYAARRREEASRLPARRLVVIDPADREQVDRFLDAIDGEGRQRGELPPRRTRAERIDSLQDALREFHDPCEVFEHFVVRSGVDNLRGSDGKEQPLRSICGKVWRPSDSTASAGRCPDCEELVGGMWTK